MPQSECIPNLYSNTQHPLSIKNTITTAVNKKSICLYIHTYEPERPYPVVLNDGSIAASAFTIILTMLVSDVSVLEIHAVILIGDKTAVRMGNTKSPALVIALETLSKEYPMMVFPRLYCTTE